MKKVLPILIFVVGLFSYSQTQAQCKADFVFYSNGGGAFVFID
jgi:hypothetical protein